MWEPFTEPGRRTMVLAQECAQHFGNNYIGPEHIFVGVMKAGDNPAADAVTSFGVTSEDVQRAAETVIERGDGTSQEMMFTARAKRIIELAFEQARDLNHNYIGAEHLVLGYLRESKGGSDLLAALHLNAKDLRAKILELIPERSSERQLRAETVARASATSLDSLFNKFAGTNIPIADLWSGLQGAAERQDAGSALAYAFCIAQRSGWNADEASAQVQKFLEEHPE